MKREKTNTDFVALKFCDLDFDPRCLNHHKSKKTPIRTVSVNQARKPIYSSSINKNQFYEKVPHGLPMGAPMVALIILIRLCFGGPTGIRMIILMGYYMPGGWGA